MTIFVIQMQRPLLVGVRIQWLYFLQKVAQSAGAVEYTDCTSAEG